MISKLISVIVFLVFAISLSANIEIVGRNGSNDTFKLVGPDSRQQLVVTNSIPNEHSKDVTGTVIYSSTPNDIVEIESGFVKPLKNGQAIITVELDGKFSSIEVLVSNIEDVIPINFTNEIAPILTKLGCNSGGCHGKSGGQNGFRLSLLGYEPWNDWVYLTQESRGRRIFTPAPNNSLLLTKAIAEIPHGGGVRLDPNSYDYDFILRWISMGAPYGKDGDPVITKIDVYPKHNVGQFGETQQLSVTAQYSDGSFRDVTRAVKYESNQEEMVSVNDKGLVKFNNIPGSASVMVRFQNYVSVYIADIPLGASFVSPTPKNFIDNHIFKKLELLGLPPSELSDDSSFLRRVSIDIAGRIPTKEESIEFLKDTDPNKRALVIDRLLGTEEYAEYFASKWAVLLRNKREMPEYSRGTFAFYDWLKSNINKNVPYDEFVVSLVTASGDMLQNPAVSWYRAVPDPKEEMQDISQVFLGIRMECAQCHHAPFDKWSQDDYYGMSAFFSTLQRKPSNFPGETIVYHKRSIAGFTNPNTKEKLLPTVLEGKPLNIEDFKDPRYELANWIKDPKNPLLSKMFVNRYWSHFFGRGIVEPEDDMRLTNPATHPELLDELANHFVESGFDMKEVIRTICNSYTYQLSVEPNGYNIADVQNYSRYYSKRLKSEVLLDGINLVGNTSTGFNDVEALSRAVALPDDQYTKDIYFLNVFGRSKMESACSCSEGLVGATLAQSLHLLNSPDIQSKLSRNTATPELLLKSNISDEEKITELYLRAFSRYPTSEELKEGSEYLKGEDSKARLEDVLWSLLNSKEFLFNH